LKIVCLYKGAAATLGAAGYTDYVCLKNAHRVWFLISHSGANDTDLTAIGLEESTDVAAGTKAAVTETFPIWSIHAASYLTGDTWTRETDAAAYTPIDPALYGDTTLLFEWDPTKHTAGYDCIAVRCAGGHANNNINVWAFMETRYVQASPPAAIVD
jgi:hypothetical protein